MARTSISRLDQAEMDREKEESVSEFRNKIEEVIHDCAGTVWDGVDYVRGFWDHADAILRLIEEENSNG